MKKVLAISGGVDSMFLLWKYRNDSDAVVAHFNHGTRASADDDARFVERKAKEYGLPFYMKKVKLGPNVSEASARAARYDFLEELAKAVGGEIYTAHHLNDLCETVAINLVRGTGWRGLAPFYNHNIKRPFIHIPKSEIHKMAAENEIEFRQDPTNNEEKYLRNRIRATLDTIDDDLLKRIDSLYLSQSKIRSETEGTVSQLLTNEKIYNRNWFKELDNTVAIEILREIASRNMVSLTYPQLLDFLKAIRTYAPHKKFNLPGGRFATIYKDYFVL